MIERVGFTVRDPTAVDVTAHDGNSAIVRHGDGSLTVDNEDFVSRGGAVRPLDLHHPTVNAVGGDGFFIWEHGRTLPLNLQVDDTLTATECLTMGRHEHCLEGVTVRTPAANITSVHRVSHPNRVMGIFPLVFAAMLMTVPLSIVTGSDPPGASGWTVAGAFTGVTLVPLVWGLWHLIVPAHEETMTVDGLRDRIRQGTL